MALELKLISIHVPKSGGTSFRASLDQVYGSEAVQTAYVDRALRQRLIIRPGVRVLHGHINLTDYQRLILDYPEFIDLPLVSWIRNPIERVISEYFYMRGVLQNQLQAYENETPTLKNRMIRSIDEFALHHGSRNAFSRFINLEHIKMGKYVFIGEVEDYSNDFDKLRMKFGWQPSINPQFVNRTKVKKEVGSEIKKRIADLNEEDMSLYDYILTNKKAIND